MKPFTREEEACFKTALALVVVKKRLLQKQQQQSDHDDATTNGRRQQSNATPKRHHGGNNNDSTTTKKVRTMESLMFPWTTTANNNNNSADQTPHVPMTLPQASLQQKGHIQTMMATALRTALRLVANDNNANKNTTANTDDTAHHKSLWTTLGGLTTHLAHQLSLALSLAAKNNNTANNSATPSPRGSTNWVKEWVRETFQQLLHTVPTTTTATGATSSSSSSNTTLTNNHDDASLIQATFLVWHGILLGSSHGTSATATGAAPSWQRSSSKSSATSRSHSDPHRAACRGLFVEVFCDMLQQEGILPTAVAASTASVSFSSKKDSSDSQKQLPTTRPPRSRHAWQRIFSVAHTRHPHHHRRRHLSRTRTTIRTANGQAAQGPPFYDLSNLWVVHGLQLLQQVRALPADTNNRHNRHHRDEPRSRILDPWLPPELFLPPLQVTQWYVDTVDRHLEQQQPLPHHSTTPTTTTAIHLDPGSQLMSMIALCPNIMPTTTTTTQQQP